MRSLNDNLASTADALFQKFFIINDECATWNKATFSDFITSTTGGDWGQEAPSGNYTEQVSCIRGTDIPQLNLGSIADAPTRYILPKNFLAKKVKADNLVVEISGGSPVQATGRIALVPEQVLKYRGDKIICSNFCRVIEVNTDYLYFFLQYWLYLYRNGRMFDYENSSTGLKNFDFTSFVEREEIVMPPIEVARHFNELAAPIYAEIFNAGFEIQHLIETRNHVLPRLMTKGY
jgi:type I restriction enzyme S subunit